MTQRESSEGSDAGAGMPGDAVFLEMVADFFDWQAIEALTVLSHNVAMRRATRLRAIASRMMSEWRASEASDAETETAGVV